MATTAAGVFAAGTWPSTRRREKVRPIPKSKLPISASEKQPQLRAQSLSQNDVVEKKSRSEELTLTLKDYFDRCRQLFSTLDGGPPRWFSPLECASHSKDSPLLLYLPGVDGTGLGLTLHHERLSKMFDIWCMHIPLKDRTSFTELVKFVESAVRMEHSRAPNRPIYLVGESFGGCLALAVAARNPDIDLMLILANPGTSFEKSLVQPETLLTLSAFMPKQINSILPYVLTLLSGTPVKMVTSAMGKRLPSDQMIKQLSQDTIAMSSYLSVLSKSFTAETLVWKLEMLKSAAAFANSRLHAVKAQTLILSSGKDELLPSREEAERLSKELPNCKIRVFEDKGHALFLDEDVSFASILISTSFYRRGRCQDYVTDYFQPTISEFQRVCKPHEFIKAASDPVVLSTLGDGSIVRSLDGIPCEGPVLYVGYHMMFALDVVPLVSRIWVEKNIPLRGMAHPMLFTKLREVKLMSSPYFDFINIMGAVPVSATDFYRLLSSKSHVLLFPGGAREAIHRKVIHQSSAPFTTRKLTYNDGSDPVTAYLVKGEEYKLFWPEQSEFVRMAANFGAKIVPFGTVGEDDICHLLLDYDDLNSIPNFSHKIPFLKNDIEEIKKHTVNVRKDATGEIANQDIHLPIVVPKVPGRLYFLLGKPIETQGRKHELMRSREKAHELYLEVKSEVEKCLSYLKEKRESDPYRNIFARLSYQATHGFDSEVPTFDFTTKDSSE